MEIEARPGARGRRAAAGLLLWCALVAGSRESRSEEVAACVAHPSGGDAARAGLAEPTGVLSHGVALTAALLGNPELVAFSWEVRAREARALQADLSPNPELRGDLENVAGAGDRQAFEDTESTLRLSQRIELGGKRGRRRQVADLDRALAGFDYQAKRLSVASEVARAFAAVLARQESVELAGELERVAAESLRAVQAQVEAGAAAPVAATRARVALGRSRAEQLQAERQLAQARVALAATWGSSCPGFSRVAAGVAPVGPLPPLAELVGRVARNPDVARWDVELEQRSASLALEEAQAVPNVTVGAGARHFADNGDAALVFELAVPLPVFDRNQGGVAEAQSRLAKGKAEREAATLSAVAALTVAYERLLAAREQAALLHDEVLPQAQAALDGARDAQRRGLYRDLEVLDAQRTLFELRGEYLQALEVQQMALADLERLTGAPLADAGMGGAR